MASAKCRNFWRAAPAFVSITVAALVIGVAPIGAVTQSQISSTETSVATLENTIANEQMESMVMDGEYLAVQSHLQALQSQLTVTQHLLASTRSKVRGDRRTLRNDAISAYMYNLPVRSVDSLFANSTAGSSERSQYETLVAGNLTAALHTLQRQQAKLTATTNLEQTQQQQAQLAATQLQALEIANERAAQAAQATLGQVRGTLASQVAQYATQQAQAEATYAASHHGAASTAAHAATQDAAVAVALGGASATQAVAAANQAVAAAGGAQGVAAAPSGSRQGYAAVAAAVSQLGVPYVWGGESVGYGFDCSGLTQWAWRQAGVDIPRVAADQAAAIPHVPLTALQPGDLLFYYNLDDDHQIDHVVMYVGSGPYGTQTIIQAPYTGSVVQFAPLFTEGLVFAGRP